MPHVFLPLTSIEGRRNICDAVKDLLVSAGWTLYQDLTLETLYGYVMRSRGSSGTAFPVYLEIRLNNTTTRIDFYQSRGWNLATKARTQRWTMPFVYTPGDTAWTNVIGAANEDSFCLFVMDGSSRFFVNSLDQIVPLNPNVAHGVLQADVTANSARVLQLAAGQADNFVVGKSYQITDEVSRAWVVAAAVDKVNHTVTVSISYNFTIAKFAMIGDFPDRWVGNSQTGSTQISNYMPVNTTATTNVTGNFAVPKWLTHAWVDPDSVKNLIVLEPVGHGQANNQAFSGFSLPHSVWRYHTLNTTNYHTLAVGSRDTGTSTGSNGAATLNDTGKAWTTNEFANKACIITAGTGEGQIRKISSNTATQITVSTNWDTVPDATSQYEIADEGWLYVCVYAAAANSRFLRVV